MSLAWVVIGSCLDGIQRDVSLAWVVIGSCLDGIQRDVSLAWVVIGSCLDGILIGSCDASSVMCL